MQVSRVQTQIFLLSFFLLNNFSAAAIFNIAEMYNQFFSFFLFFSFLFFSLFPLCVLYVLIFLIFFFKVIIGHKCVARLTVSIPLSARRVVVVRGRSLFHQWMGSDFLSFSSFPLSAGRVVVVRGCSLFHQWVGSDFSLSVCLSLFLSLSLSS